MTGDEDPEAFLRLGEVEHHEHIWKDGEYHGCVVTYAHPLMSELKTVFHPYIPLTVYGVLCPGGPLVTEPWPKLTREYFLLRGLAVPGESTSVH